MQFLTPPCVPVPVTKYSKANIIKLSPLIEDLVKSGAISKVEASEDQHVYRVFSVPKKNGKERFIIDLSPLNLQIKKVHFRMEDSQFIKSMISKNDFMASIDLADAFFSIPLHESSKKYICFDFNGTRYSYNVIPFGLTSSPRVFSKILKPAISHLRAQGIKLSSYLDDIIIVAPDPNSLKAHLDVTIDLLLNLGFFINYEKSILSPSQTLNHLGYLWNSCDLNISIPVDKILKIRKYAHFILNNQTSIRNISSFLGTVVSMGIGFPLSPLYYRALQLCFLKHRENSHSWDDPFFPDENSIENLTWWANCPSPLTPASMKSFAYSITLSTDASLAGWGAHLSNGLSSSGEWPSDSLSHINFLELKAIFNGLSHLLPHIKNKSLRILSDNVSSIYYINKIGGTHSIPMCNLALKIWKLLIDNNIHCKAFHISGVDNVCADDLSRNNYHLEFQISHVAFNQVTNLIPFPLNVDLFASRHSRKISKFVSRFYDELAWKTDAFSFRWPGNVYIFPPINLIPKVLIKFKSDNVDNSLLITPAWHTLSSLPSIIELLCAHPIFIPSSLIEGVFPTRRPFNLVAWPISSLLASRKDFQTRPSLPSSIALTQKPSPFIRNIGKIFSLGPQKDPIPFLALET